MRTFFTLLFSLAVLSATTLPAQTDSTRKTNLRVPGHYLALNLSQLYSHRQVQVTYGRRIAPKWALEGEAAAKWRWPLREPYYRMTERFTFDYDHPSQTVHHMPFSHAYSGSVWATRYLRTKSPRVQPYLTVGFLYQYSQYKNQLIRYQYTNNHNFNYYETAYHHTYGLKALAGWRIAALRWGKTNLVVDPYLGFGVRNRHTRSIRTYTDDNRLGMPGQTFDSRKQERVPSLHLGLRAGLAW